MNRIHSINSNAAKVAKPTLKVNVKRKVSPRKVEAKINEEPSELAKRLESLVDKEEVARVLDIKVSTVERWIRNETIPCYKIGTVVRFDIDEIIERHEGKTLGGK